MAGSVHFEPVEWVLRAFEHDNGAPPDDYIGSGTVSLGLEGIATIRGLTARHTLTADHWRDIARKSEALGFRELVWVAITPNGPRLFRRLIAVR